MEVEFKSELHRYASLKLNEKEVEIFDYINETEFDSKLDLYERNGTHFMFAESSNTTIDKITDYLSYAMNHQKIKLKIRKHKIEKIRKGS